MKLIQSIRNFFQQSGPGRRRCRPLRFQPRSIRSAQNVDPLEQRLLLSATNDDDHFFSDVVLEAVTQLDRIVEATSEVQELANRIVWLGEIAPEIVGSTTEVQANSLSTLLDLPERFRTEIVQPLQAFLEQNPAASAAEIAGAFGFIQPVTGVSGLTEGIQIQFDLNQTIVTPLAGLITQLQGDSSLLNAIDGDTLNTLLNFDLQLPELNFQILRDTADRIGIAIPDISIDVTHNGDIPIDFAAGLGFLGGRIEGGSIDLNTSLELNSRGLFQDISLPGPLAGLISLEDLRQISFADILDTVEVVIGGSGLNIDFPFEFELPGLNHGGFLPTFTLSDLNPFDTELPNFDFSVPAGAPYELRDILSFQTIDSSSVLQQLEQLGSVFGLWEDGQLLNTPIPLADNLTLSDAVGLAEGYGSAVLQFLSSGNGVPSFGSVQELAALIPGLDDGAEFGPVRYDAANQQLLLSLNFFRSFDPIVGVANLSAFAGNEQSPIVSFTMDSGDAEEGLLNRVELTGSIQAGLELAIDLSRQAIPVNRLTSVQSVSSGDVPLWAPVSLLLHRFGAATEDEGETTATVQLRNGQPPVVLNLGRLDDDHTTVFDLIRRGRIYDGTTLLFSTGLQHNRLIFTDHTSGATTTSVEFNTIQPYFLFDGLTDTDADGVIRSNLLNQSPIDGGFPLRWATRIPLDPALALPSAPLRFIFADGTERTQLLPSIFSMTSDDLINELALDRAGTNEPLLRAKFDNVLDRFILEDQTTPLPDGQFRIEWSGTNGGSPAIAQFLPVGVDADRDGKLVGPRIVPELPYAGASPIDAHFTLGRLFIEDAVYAGDSTARFELRSGEVVTLSTGVLTRDMTVGTLIDQLQSQAGSNLLVDFGPFLGTDDIRFFDNSNGSGNFSLVETTGGFFGSLLPPDPFVSPEAITASRIIGSPSLSSRGPRLTDLILPLIPESSANARDRAARVTLLDGTTHEIAVGPVSATTTLADIAESLTVYDGGSGVLLLATVENNHIVLQDRTIPTGPDSEFSIDVRRASGITRFFLHPAAGDSGVDGRIDMQSFMQPSNEQIAYAQPPSLLFDTQTAPPDWTTMRLLNRRYDGEASADDPATFTITLRDGTPVELNISDPATTTIAEIAATKWYRNDNPADGLIAEINYVDGRLVIHDRTTTGSGTLTVDGTGEAFFAWFPIPERSDSDGDRMLVSRPLQRTVFEDFGGHLGIRRHLTDPPPTENDFSMPIEYSLRDGTTHRLFSPGSLSDLTLNEFLEFLTVRRNGKVVVEASVVNGSIVLTNHETAGEHPFSIAIEEPVESGFSLWPKEFLNFGTDLDGDGVILSAPFFPQLPDADVPPRDGSALIGGIAITAATTLGDYVEALGMPDVLGEPNLPMIAYFRDGTSMTFTVQNDSTMTLMEYARQFNLSRDDQPILSVELQQAGRNADFNSVRFVLYDRTSADGGGFLVAVDPAAGLGLQILPSLLGLAGIDNSDSGVLAGPLLNDAFAPDNVRIQFTEPPMFHAEFTATASDVNASIALGELLGGGIRNGSGMVSGLIDIQFVPPVEGEDLSLNDLIAGAAHPSDLIDVTVDLDAAFEAEVFLDIAGLNVPPDSPSETPRIFFDWPDAITADPTLRVQTENLTYGYENFENLARFDGLTVQDITNLIRKVVDLVERMTGDNLLNRRLPLVNTTLAEILDTTDYFADLIDQIQDDPDVGLDLLETEIEALLGFTATPGRFQLLYDEDLNAIRVELNLHLDSGPQTASLDIDLAGAGVAGLDALVDFQASGDVGVQVAADLLLHLGLGLDELRTGSFDDAVFVYGTTGISGSTTLAADNLNFTTTVATLGVDVTGRARLDADGLAFGGTENNAPATILLSLDDPGATYPLLSLTADDFNFSFDAVAGLDVAVDFLATQDTPLQIHWPHLDTVNFTTVPSISLTGGNETLNQIVLPDFSDAIDGFSIADGVYALVAGIEGLFALIEDHLGERILGVPVPVVGEALSDLTDFVGSIAGRIGDEIDEEGSNVLADTARLAIFDAIGPAGLNILDDSNDDGSITVDDVIFSLSGNEVIYRLTLGQDLIASDAMINLDIGGSALGLEIEGDVAARVGFAIDVGFGLSADGVFVEFYDGNEIELNFSASIDDLAAMGNLGPLSISATTIDAADVPQAMRDASRLDPNDPDSEQINSVAGTFGFDLGNPAGERVGLTSLPNVLLNNSRTNLTLAGSIHASIVTSVGTSASLPSIGADVHLTWANFSGENPAPISGTLSQAGELIGKPQVKLTDVNLDLGSFINDVLQPILGPINDFLDPLRPVLDAITTPIPVLSDLAGEVTFVDLIGLFGDGAESVGPFVEAIADLARLVDIPRVNGSLKLPLGDFETTYDVDGKLLAGAAAGAFGVFGSFDAFLGAQTGGDIDAFFDQMPRESGSPSSVTPGKFSLPILDDPSSVIGLLFGEDVDLVYYQAPRLEAGFTYSQGFPVIPGVNVSIGGGFSVAADFAFGYDTAGIRQFAQSKRVADLFNGFFLSDDRRVPTDLNDDGEITRKEFVLQEQNELEFSLSLLAGASVGIPGAELGIEGGLFATIGLDLNDPDEDGKIRAQELLDNLNIGRHPLLGPLWVFDASGKLEAGLRVYLNTPFFDTEKAFGPFEILNFNIPRPEPRIPELGHVEQDGRLVVHVGPNAALREEGDLSDGDDDILIAIDEDTGDVLVSGYGRDQVFEGVTSIFIDSGLGDDRIYIDQTITIPITAYLGAGADSFTGGGATSIVLGGSGDDFIVGGAGNDNIDGQAGNDRIDGGAGNDTLRGGAGDDFIQGQAGMDVIHGDAGNDQLNGGADSDFIFGGDGNDNIDGGAGDDVLRGEAENGSGSGNDFIQGGSGADKLYGGPGNDRLFGNNGADELYGEADNDLLVAANAPRDSVLYSATGSALDTNAHRLEGGTGHDRIYGSAGVDTVIDIGGVTWVSTYEGDDSITTGDENDEINSGPGNDTINAGNGQNTIRGGAGFEFVVTGFGLDFIDLRPEDGSVEAAGSEIFDAGGANNIFTDDGPDIITALGSNFIVAGGGDNVITTLGAGGDTIRTGSGNDTINAGDGNNEVVTGAGNDSVTTGSGNDLVQLGDGNDWSSTGAGNDVIIAGTGDDFVDAGSGDDLLNGGAGNDELIGGMGADVVRGGTGSDVIWGGPQQLTRTQIEASLLAPLGYDANLAFIGFDVPLMNPAVVNNTSISASELDGADDIDGGTDNDFIFGDGGADLIVDPSGTNYIDAGLGNDDATGGRDSDIILGGGGNDALRGGAGIDFLYGGAGDDDIQGDAGVDAAFSGTGDHELYGQMLFGGPGNDRLFAFAPTVVYANETGLLGDRLDGGDGNDELFGNIRGEVLIGGFGDDILLGDFQRGGVNNAATGFGYGLNDSASINGGNDILRGDEGDDILRGHGGNDILWGGANTDELEGHDGTDRLFGGRGIDFLILDVSTAYAIRGTDTLLGHGDDAPGASIADDNATDILKIEGTDAADTILVGQAANGNLLVRYNGTTLEQPWRDDDDIAAIEQIQIDGHEGNDILGFVLESDLVNLNDADLNLFDEATLPVGFGPVDFSDLALRSSDWVGVINGGDGDDTIKGSAGRDRLNGGPGSDTIFGVAGDDRLWGDEQDGASSDHDRLFAGVGFDDLIGGVGTNELFAWTASPGAVSTNEVPPVNFGIWVDPTTGLRYDNEAPGREREDTGLNRQLGRSLNDTLFGGTGLDFLYGGDGDDMLVDRYGVPLEFGLGVPEDEEWLEYARSTDRVWYYGGSGANDIITVDYVTEPGILGDHHLITRLTENNGQFTFDAQVKLDFEATDANGNRIWNPDDIVLRFNQINSIEDDDERGLAFDQFELEGNILPAEGDFLAIIIDAQRGDDEIYVGPTVQRSVWVTAGEGNDRVEFSGGSAILVDLTDAGNRNEITGNPLDISRAYSLGSEGHGPVANDVVTRRSTVWKNLTLDSPNDVDWYALTFDDSPNGAAALFVDSIADSDDMELQIYRIDNDGNPVLLSTGTLLGSGIETTDDALPSRSELVLAPLELKTGVTYFVRVRSNDRIPTRYNLSVDLDDNPVGGTAELDLGIASDILRRDVLVGGPGHDVLVGGPGEDWIIGGPGNDVLTGGFDGEASDLIFGEDGDDLLQVIPQRIAGNSGIGTSLLTLTDEFEGGDGFDRMYFLGGDVDQFGSPIADDVALRYDRLNNRFEIGALVDDGSGGTELQTVTFRTRGVEGTLFDLGAGDDSLHLNDGFVFPDTGNSNTWGIVNGDREAGAYALAHITILGGNGSDRIFGSPYADEIYAGEGIDLVLGYGGDDRIFGDSGQDLLIGDVPANDVSLFDEFEITSRGGQAVTNDSVINAIPLDLSNADAFGLTLNDNDSGDWYVVGLPIDPGQQLDISDFGINFTRSSSDAAFNLGYDDPLLELFPAVLDPTTQSFYVPTTGTPETYLLHVRNPRSSAAVATNAPAIPQGNVTVSVKLHIDGLNGVRSLPNFTATPSDTGVTLAEKLNIALANVTFTPLDEILVADFDSTLQRIVLTSRDGRGFTFVDDVPNRLFMLGFEEGQSNDGSFPGLGEYSLGSRFSMQVPPASLTSGDVAPIEYRPGMVDPNFVPPLTTIDVSSNNPLLSEALRLEGNSRNERLQHSSPIGDINGDGIEDVMLWSTTRAYIFLGGITGDVNVATAEQSADHVITLDGYVPISGGRDFNQDGRIDLGFYRVNPGAAAVVQFGLLDAVRIAERSIPSFQIEDLYTLDYTAGFDVLDVHWLDYNDDVFADLMVFARTPVLESNANVHGYGGVISGQYLQGQFDPATPQIPFTESLLAWVNDSGESHAAVEASIPGLQQYASGGPVNQQLHAVAGDFDADGIDELALAIPEGWLLDGALDDITVGRVYIVGFGSSPNVDITLGSAAAPARIQQTALSPDGNSSVPVLNLTTPLLAADFNHDGFTDLVTATQNKDAANMGVRIFSGRDIPFAGLTANLLTETDASISIAEVGSNDVRGLHGLTMSTGDFDGDRTPDLALGATGAAFGTGTLTIAYNPFDAIAGGGSGELVFGDNYGDSRPDFVTMTGISFGGRFGTLSPIATDITGDGIADLFVGSAEFNGTADGVEINSGAMFVIPGAGRRIVLPPLGDVITLSNDTRTGLGGVLIEDGLIERGGTDAFDLAPGEEKWFRFTTLGDGQAGDVIRVGPIFHEEPTPVFDGVAGDILSSRTSPRSDTATMQVGDGRIGVLEFDLSSLLAAYEDSSLIEHADLRLIGSIEQNSTVAAPSYVEELTLTSNGQKAFFSGYTDDEGQELWLTDGTAEGTQLAFDINPGFESSNPANLTAIGDYVFFTTEIGGSEEGGEGGSSVQLWLTDGNDLVEAEHPTSEFYSIREVVEFNGALYFNGDDPEYRNQLWTITIDGTGKPTLTRLTTVADAFNSLTIGSMLPTPNGLFFRRPISGGGEQLWVTDGSAAGTEMLRQFNPASGSLDIAEDWTAYSGGLLFSVDPGYGSGDELWFSDGTSGGTNLVHDVSGSGDGRLHSLHVVGSNAFFMANGGELWQTDGTGAEMISVLHAQPSPLNNGIGIVVDDLYVVALPDFSDGHVYLFSVDDNGVVLQSNKTAGNGVDSIIERNGVAIIGVHTQGFGSYPDRAQLVAFGPTDGSLTVLADVDDFNRGPVFEELVITANGYIIADGPGPDAGERHVWVSDGTTDGTKELDTTGGGASQPVTVNVAVRPADRDNVIDAGDLEADAVITRTVTLSAASPTAFIVDLVQNADDLAELRRLFDLGYRSFSISLGAIGNGTATIDAPNGVNTGLRVTQSAGVAGTLTDADGRVIESEFNHFDARNLTAGTYFLRIANGADAIPSGPSDGRVAARLLIDAPTAGHTHATTSNDTLVGGDGDDIIVGSVGKDILFGNSGLDVFVAQPFELRDIADNELRRDIAVGHAYEDGDNTRQLRDPQVLINQNEPLPPGFVQFDDFLFAQFIAETLGITSVSVPGGGVEFARPVTTSELASLTALGADASLVFSRANVSRSGLQYLTGLDALTITIPGNFNSTELALLQPANLGAEGARFLRHLNLDGNEITDLTPLAGLSNLTVLSIANQVNATPLTNIGPLQNLLNLVYVDISGNSIDNIEALSGLNDLRILDIADNVVTSLDVLLDSQVMDDSQAVVLPAGALQTNAQSSSLAFNGYYRTLNAQVDPTGRVIWQFTNLEPGEYEILATWFADDSHTSNAVYTFGVTTTTTINQQSAPADYSFGGRVWGVLGTVNVDSSGSVIVTLFNGTDGLNAIADAVMVRPVAVTVPNLKRIDLTANPLESNTYDALIPVLQQRAIVDTDNNQAPQWTGNVGHHAADSGGKVVVDNLLSFVSSSNDPITFTATTDHSGVTVVQTGADSFQFQADGPASDRAINVLLTATDARGRSSIHPFAIAFDSAFVEGTITDDLNGQPVEGVIVYLDNNSDGQRQSGEPTATTDMNGDYRIWTDVLTGVNLRVKDDGNLFEADAYVRNVEISEATIYSGNDFILTKVLSINGPATAFEGQLLNFDADINLNDPNGEHNWTVTGPGLSGFSLDDKVLTFTPEQDGIFTFRYTFEPDVGGSYSVTHIVEVSAVAPVLNVGGDIIGANAVIESRLNVTREMIVDPGTDLWTVTIDYGDGSAPVTFLNQNSRDITLAHIYPRASANLPGGVYTITITVQNEEGSFTDTLDVEVLPEFGDAIIDLYLPAFEGLPVQADFNVDDETFAQNIGTWSYVINWGDGSGEISIAADLIFDTFSNSIFSNATLFHTYAVQGDYTITFTVIDEDGDSITATNLVTVRNAAPVVDPIVGPTAANEDAVTSWNATAFDLDADLTYQWDFGDGSLPRTGANIDHVFTVPGTFVVSLSVSDGVDFTTISRNITIKDTPDAPVIDDPGILRWNELSESGAIIKASDSDTDDTIVFALEGAPVGLTIDGNSGLLKWEPTSEQGGRRYTAFVTATDSTGRLTRLPLTLEVQDSGSIHGRVFYDHNENGSADNSDRSLAGQVVTLDLGRDGTIDAQTTTDAQGHYSFEGLAVGLYVVEVTTSGAYKATTPLKFEVNMDVPEDRMLNSIGIVTPRDFGDAPDPLTGTGVGDYETRDSDTGPVHYLTNLLRMGSIVTAESSFLNGQLDTGDDGVVSPDSSLILTVGVAPSVIVNVTNQTGQNATLHGWIDYNGDGIFDSATEYASVIVPDGATGSTVTLNFPIVPENVTNAQIYSRFRLSTDIAASSPTGIAIDGEVEDYVASIRPAVPVLRTQNAVTEDQRPTFTWDAVPGSVGYEIWIRNQSTAVNPYVRQTVTDTSWTADFNMEIGLFYVWIRALGNNTAHSVWSVPFVLKINTAPELNTVGPVFNVPRPEISWPALAGAVRYEIWINSVNPTQIYLRDDTLTQTSWIPDVDLPLGSYRIWVRAFSADNRFGRWSKSIPISIRTIPTVTSANATFDRTPVFTWTSVVGADAYDIWIRDSSGADILIQNNLVATSFEMPFSLADGIHRFWVRARRADGFPGNWTIAAPLNVGGRPTILNKSNQVYSVFPEIRWGTVEGAVRYDLWVNQLNGQPQIIRETDLTSTSFTPSTLPAGTYRIWIRAISGSGEVSVWSAPIDVKIVHQTLDHPDLLPGSGLLPRLLDDGSLDSFVVAEVPSSRNEYADVQSKAKNQVSASMIRKIASKVAAAEAQGEDAQDAELVAQFFSEWALIQFDESDNPFNPVTAKDHQS